MVATVIRDRLPVVSLVLAVLWGVIQPKEAQVNVTQHHNHDSRDGIYVEPAFTRGQLVT